MIYWADNQQFPHFSTSKMWYNDYMKLGELQHFANTWGDEWADSISDSVYTSVLKSIYRVVWKSAICRIWEAIWIQENEIR